MNWVEYSVRKPEAEPERQLLVARVIDGDREFGCIWSHCEGQMELTHWCEIEPPTKREPPPETEFDRQMAKLPRTKEELGKYILKLGAVWKKEEEERRAKIE